MSSSDGGVPGAAGSGGGGTARAAPTAPGGGRSPRDAGFVTAETAVVLPTLVLFTMALVWALLAASAQIQCVDAARAGARAMARQDPPDAAVAAARQAAPRGARVVVRREGDLVRVEVVVPSPGPEALGLGLRLRAEAVALAEETVGMGA
ncbi:TadE family type IV pilus minor pilin [Streptomyces sp. NPDC059063]|uniref:TadE family type IV pilus minor pilin n=1 Tax=unclassified Streptomyces TaxID=2593676 RepID=UPI003684DC02